MIVVLIDNFRHPLAKLAQGFPPEPLYFIKGNNSFLAHGELIRAPKSYSGKVEYEGELGVVIGRRTSGEAGGDAAGHNFCYICANYVIAIAVIAESPGF